MDSKIILTEVEQSSQNARPSGPPVDAVSLETVSTNPGTLGVTGLRSTTPCSQSDAESLATDELVNDSASVLSQKSIASSVVGGIGSLDIVERKAFYKFTTVAQTKAFKRALKAGKSRAVALAEAKAAVSGQTKVNKATNSHKEARSTHGAPQSYSNVLKCTRLGVLPAGTEAHLSKDDLEKITSAILTEVRKNDDVNLRLEFGGISQKSGWLQVNCSNTGTVNWIRSKAEALATSTGIALKVVDETAFPKPHLIRGFFSRSEKDSTEEILTYLRTQSWLPTEKWQTINRVSCGTIEEIVFAVDSESLDRLEKEKYTAPFKFGTVKFIKVNQGKRKNEAEAEQTQDDKKARTTSPQRVHMEPERPVVEEPVAGPSGATRPPTSKATTGNQRGPARKTAEKPSRMEIANTSGSGARARTTPGTTSGARAETSPNVLQLRSRLKLGSRPPMAKNQRDQRTPRPTTGSAGSHGPSRPNKGPRGNQHQKLITQTFSPRQH